MRHVSRSSRGSSMVRAEGPSRRRVLQNIGFGVVAAAITGWPPTYAQNTPVVGYGAPLAEIDVPAGLLTAEQKADMIRGITDVIADALKIPPPQQRALWVLIIETASGGWGVAGQPH